MKASKENANIALECLQKIQDSEILAVTFITDFVKAAQKKLPSEAAYERDTHSNRQKRSDAEEKAIEKRYRKLKRFRKSWVGVKTFQS